MCYLEVLGHLCRQEMWCGGNMSWCSGRTAWGHTLLLIHPARQNMLSGVRLHKPLTLHDSLVCLADPPPHTHTHFAFSLQQNKPKTLPVSRTFLQPNKKAAHCSVVFLAVCEISVEKYWHSETQLSPTPSFTHVPCEHMLQSRTNTAWNFFLFLIQQWDVAALSHDANISVNWTHEHSLTL